MIQPKPSDREDRDPFLEASTQLELTQVEVLPSQSTRTKIRKPRNLPRTEPPLFTTKSMEMRASGAPVISATQAFLKPPDWSEYGQDGSPQRRLTSAFDLVFYQVGTVARA